MSGWPASLWRRLRHRRPAVTGAAVAWAAVLVILFVSVQAAVPVERHLGVSGVDIDLLNRFGPPTVQHLLGADIVGRDELARLLRGGRTFLGIGLMVALGTSLIGTLIGAVSGYAGGRTDTLLMPVTDFAIAVAHLPILVSWRRSTSASLGSARTSSGRVTRRSGGS